MTTTDTAPRIPDGFMEDASGRLVPLANVKPQHKLEDELVRELHADAQAMREALKAFKERAFGRVHAFMEMLEQEYGSKGGGQKGNLGLASYDGSLKVQLAVGEYVGFGPELQVAKQLVDDCLRSWSEGANDNI